MSYIINNTNPFVSTKLTDKGRELLAKGQLTFSSWAIGDSEINYSREEIVDSNPLDATLNKPSMILRPKDDQPKIKYYVNNGGENPLMPLTNADIKTLKLQVNNQATERGFFNHSGNTFTTKATPDMIVATNVISNLILDGSNVINIGPTAAVVGDFLLIKTNTDSLDNIKPVPYLWFKIISILGDNLTLDRPLPRLSLYASFDSLVIIYKGGEVYNGFGSALTSAYWDTGTLSFDSSCDITREDVPVWNQNNVYAETLAGIVGNLYEDHTRFGSYDYLGQMNQYLEYSNTDENRTEVEDENCSEISALGVVDPFKKAISILHYTNNTISNLYGEFLYIDNVSKTVKVHMPDLMYHRRFFPNGSGTGNLIGMSFIASGATKVIGSTDIEYVDLIEDPAYLGGRTPRVVGKVFTQLKMIVIEDAEIVTAMSYKSNRNWTLPELAVNLVASTDGGVLQSNETMYITYSLESKNILTQSLDCQHFMKISNPTPTGKDIEFRIAETGMFPYMRKIENGIYNGEGFMAEKLFLIYQVVQGNGRPDPALWKKADFTSLFLTTGAGQTIDPLKLENQNPNNNSQFLNSVVDNVSEIYEINTDMSMAPIISPDILQFGDERFFYGNIEASIGATIYKTLFDIRIDSGQFSFTSNPTRSSNISTNPPNIKVSEVGIYDNNNELVIIGKLSKPVELVSGQTIMIEISMDF